jgi:hypothetical protein
MCECVHHKEKWEIFLLKGPAADATDAPKPWRLIVQLCEKDDEDDAVFYAFPF